jgi:Ran GTPase-activating protein (RanGAP) involved in mRNA processing and transport
MRPILSGEQTAALFAHFMIGPHLPVVLDFLARTKVVSELDLAHNALSSASVPPLVAFVCETDQLSLLRLDGNPIGPAGVRDLVTGIKDSRSLEEFSIANTGAGQIVGRALAQMLAGCTSLLKLNVSHCALRQSMIDVAQALPQSATLRRLNVARNELFYGRRRLGLQFGINAAKCSALTRIDLSQNALTTDMAMGLLKGLGDATHLHRLDLSRNEINEPAGRAFVAFIGKSVSLRRLDVSHNPILNVTKNKVIGQKKLEEELKKPGLGKKDKKNKVYVPACYAMVAALVKSSTVKQVDMQGMVVDPWEWEGKLAVLRDKVRVVWRAPDAEPFRFRPPPPPPPRRQPRPPVEKKAPARRVFAPPRT